LSATAQLYTWVEKLFTLPPTAFSPPPKVHSSVVRLTMNPRLESLQVPEQPFIAFLRQSFGQKRKTLWNNLKPDYDGKLLRAAMEATGIKPNARAEALSLEKMAALYRTLSPA
jgi:16S rRNA (adenine1518-N6/adenine1519-N6)-dimethyltransferase